MLDRIEIRNFKKIQGEPLILENLAQVNYLVGENGSGKSSVLERFYEQNYHNCNIRIGFKDLCTTNSLKIQQNPQIDKNTIIHVSFSLKTTDYNFEVQSQFDRLDLQQILRFNIIDLSPKEGSPMPSVETTRFNNLADLVGSKNNFDLINDLYRKRFKSEIKVKREPDPIFGNIIYCDEKGKIIDLNKLSSGFKAIRAISNKINDLINNFVLQDDRIKTTLLIFMEEPENYLHPTWQKEIPEIIQNRLKQEKEEVQARIKFLISTHSPFIVSAAASLPDQKVYLIDNGQTVDLNFDPENRSTDRKVYNTKESQNGFDDGDVLLVANKMLGLGLDDILPQKTIFCEKSMKVFLKTYFKRLDKNNYIFIIHDNEGDGIERGEILKQIQSNLRSLLKFKDLKMGDFIIICDNEPNSKQLKNALSNKNIELEINENLIVLKEDEQEKQYPDNLLKEFIEKNLELTNVWNTNEEKFIDFLRRNDLIDKKGEIKNNLAEYVGSKITEEEFKTNFQQLHTCIFSQN